MTGLRRAALALLLCSVSVPAVAQVDRMEQQITPEGKTLVHPRSGSLMLPVTGGGSLRVCAKYSTTIERQRGKIAVRIELRRAGELLEVVELRGRLKDADHPRFKRQFVGCSKARCPSGSTSDAAANPCTPDAAKELDERLRAEDLLTFDFTFRKFSQLDADDEAWVAVVALP